MRALYIDVPEELLRQRRRLGIDEFDEMWEGDLHLLPLPTWDHQGIDQGLSWFFKTHWHDLGEGVFRSHVGVKHPGTPDVAVGGVRVPTNYRGPDLVFLLRGHERRIRKGWVVGPPDAVIEIRSPGDETYQKFPFFHSLGVPEVIVIHRDTKVPELHLRADSDYERSAPASDGSVTSRVLDTVFRAQATPRGGTAVLHLRRVRFPRRTGTI